VVGQRRQFCANQADDQGRRAEAQELFRPDAAARRRAFVRFRRRRCRRLCLGNQTASSGQVRDRRPRWQSSASHRTCGRVS
jgi:hypothetical protein